MPTWNSSGSTKLILMEAIRLTTQHAWKPCKFMGFQLPISTGATAHPAHPAHPPLLKPPSTWSVRLTKSMMGKRNGLSGGHPWTGTPWQLRRSSWLEMLGIVGSEGSIKSIHIWHKQTQVSCIVLLRLPQIYHTFVLFDHPRTGNLLTPAAGRLILCSVANAYFIYFSFKNILYGISTHIYPHLIYH